MTRYKPGYYQEDKLIPISFSKQILPDSFEFTPSYVVDSRVMTGSIII